MAEFTDALSAVLPLEDQYGIQPAFGPFEKDCSVL